ncbi:MAG TPA: hypothetical protein ENH35_02870 [Candidatus Moranbacteria bacterium]|nr:hypothetical protein [Candidatus Moranbacteria bacterium]
MTKQKLKTFFKWFGIFPLDHTRHTVVIEYDVSAGKSYIYILNPTSKIEIVNSLRSAANEIENNKLN